MSGLEPAFEVIWAILKWAIPFILLLAVGTWVKEWIEGKISGARPARERKPRRCRKEKRAEAGRLARERGLAFEAALIHLFRAAGWKVEETPVTRDFGVDLIVHYSRRSYAIQAKHHRNRVGCDAVDAVYSGKAFYGCDAAVLIALGGVTDQARAKADQIGVKIWGKSDITRLRNGTSGVLPVD